MRARVLKKPENLSLAHTHTHSLEAEQKQRTVSGLVGGSAAASRTQKGSNHIEPRPRGDQDRNETKYSVGKFN